MNRNDHSLRTTLSELRIPAICEESRERALHLALEAFRVTEAPSESAPRFSWMMAGSIAAAACLLATMLWFWQGTNHEQTLASARLLAEMELLFPRQVTAVILDGSKMRIDLADVPADDPSDQRIRVTLRRGNHFLSVLTYSGRRVCLELDHRQVCFTPLLDGEGSIFVVTDNNVLVPSGETKMAGFRLSVEHLEATPS